jgi:hypothetical protein
MIHPFRKSMIAALVMATGVTTGVIAQETAAAPADPFSITLPAGFGEFAKQTQTAKSNDGTVETTNWVSKAPTGEAVVVTVSKMPGKILDPLKMIGSTRDSLVKSLNATVESDDKIPGDLVSEQVMFHSGTNAFLRARLAVKGDSLYQLLYVSRSTDQRAVPAVDQLFGSFKINGQGAMQTTALTSH